VHSEQWKAIHEETNAVKKAKKVGARQEKVDEFAAAEARCRIGVKARALDPETAKFSGQPPGSQCFDVRMVTAEAAGREDMEMMEAMQASEGGSTDTNRICTFALRPPFLPMMMPQSVSAALTRPHSPASCFWSGLDWHRSRDVAGRIRGSLHWAASVHLTSVSVWMFHGQGL
jgi:hypothetical protein